MAEQLPSTFLSVAASVLADTEKGLSGNEIVKHSSKFAFEFNVDIPVDYYPWGDFGRDVPNKRTGLQRNLEAFNAKQQFYIIDFLCDLPQFDSNEEVKELKAKLYERYSVFSSKKLSDAELINTTAIKVDKYSKSKKLYEKGVHLFETKGDPRNILDNMRLSLELLLKEVLNNQKSLENQMNELGSFLKTNNISKETRNIYMKVLSYYLDYQNSNVKHNYSINEVEVEYMIYQTSIFMNLLIDLDKNKDNNPIII